MVKRKFTQKVSKYFENEYDSVNLFALMLFMFLSTTLIVENSYILAATYFIFLNKRCGLNLKIFQ